MKATVQESLWRILLALVQDINHVNYIKIEHGVRITHEFDEITDDITKGYDFFIGDSPTERYTMRATVTKDTKFLFSMNLKSHQANILFDVLESKVGKNG